MTERVEKEEWYRRGARWVAERATCNRRKVGAILVRDGRVIAQGYNGSPPGEPHCTDEGCLLQDGHCVRTVHAEANVIATCARFGIATAGGTLYLTTKPCNNCERLIKSAGIQHVEWEEDYDPREEEEDDLQSGPLTAKERQRLILRRILANKRLNDNRKRVADG